MDEQKFYNGRFAIKDDGVYFDGDKIGEGVDNPLSNNGVPTGGSILGSGPGVSGLILTITGPVSGEKVYEFGGTGSNINVEVNGGDILIDIWPRFVALANTNSTEYTWSTATQYVQFIGKNGGQSISIVASGTYTDPITIENEGHERTATALKAVPIWRTLTAQEITMINSSMPLIIASGLTTVKFFTAIVYRSGVVFSTSDTIFLGGGGTDIVITKAGGTNLQASDVIHLLIYGE
jgi:hypothetical protein